MNSLLLRIRNFILRRGASPDEEPEEEPQSEPVRLFSRGTTAVLLILFIAVFAGLVTWHIKRTYFYHLPRETVYALGEDGNILWSYVADRNELGKPAGPSVVGEYGGVACMLSSYGIINAFSAEDGEVLWSRELEGDVSDWLLEGEGSVLCQAGDTVYSLEIDGGETLWEYSLRSPCSGAPILVENSLFIVEESGILLSVDSKTGRLHWEYELPGLVYDSIAADLDYVVVQVVGPKSLMLVSVDKETGELLCSRELVAGTSSFFQTDPISSGGYIFSAVSKEGDGGPRTTLFCVVGDNGGLVWEQTLGSPSLVELLVSGDIVCACGDNVVAVGIKDGNIKWTRDINPDVATVSAGFLYLGSSEILSVYTDTGEDRWAYDSSCAGSNGFSLSSGSEEILSLGTDSKRSPGALICLGCNSGEIRWEQLFHVKHIGESSCLVTGPYTGNRKYYVLIGER